MRLAVDFVLFAALLPFVYGAVLTSFLDARQVGAPYVAKVINGFTIGIAVAYTGRLVATALHLRDTELLLASEPYIREIVVAGFIVAVGAYWAWYLGWRKK